MWIRQTTRTPNSRATQARKQLSHGHRSTFRAPFSLSQTRQSKAQRKCNYRKNKRIVTGSIVETNGRKQEENEQIETDLWSNKGQCTVYEVKTREGRLCAQEKQLNEGEVGTTTIYDNQKTTGRTAEENFSPRFKFPQLKSNNPGGPVIYPCPVRFHFDRSIANKRYCSPQNKFLDPLPPTVR